MTPQPTRAQDEFVVRIASRSVVARVVGAPPAMAQRAWEASMVARGWSRWRAWPFERRVRLAAIVVGVAMATHLALTRLSPPPLAFVRAALGSLSAGPRP